MTGRQQRRRERVLDEQSRQSQQSHSCFQHGKERRHCGRRLRHHGRRRQREETTGREVDRLTVSAAARREQAAAGSRAKIAQARLKPTRGVGGVECQDVPGFQLGAVGEVVLAEMP